MDEQEGPPPPLPFWEDDALARCTRAPDESAAAYLARRFCGVMPWRATWRDRWEHDERIARHRRLSMSRQRRGRVA